MRMETGLKRFNNGFSLVEMAIVMAIIGLLLGGLLPTISSQVEQSRRSENRKHLDEIQQALMGYAIINGRLPCPADGTIPTAPGVANGAGQEVTVAGPPITCSSTGGVLPWATLGISETDAWGRRFTYRVTTTFADGTDGTGSACTVTTGASFQICSSGNLNIWSEVAHTTSVASNAPAVIVSHGTNGLGAYTTAGQLLSGASGDEGDNAANDNNNNFVSRDFIQNGFDDTVIWISPNILINRMVAAGKLP